MRLSWPAVLLLIFAPLLYSQDHPTNLQRSPGETTTQEKPKVFITDSQSWETWASAGGSNGNWGAQAHGGARPQTAEIIKTFGERCPQVMVNNKQSLADYIVVLDHEGGKGVLRHKNKVAVFESLSGDAVMSHSTMSLGGSVQDACEGITKHWTQHSAEVLAAKSSKQAASPSSPVASVKPVALAATSPPKVTMNSTPDGVDIEVDRSFVGNTPSSIEIAPGEHLIAIKKSGYKEWSRKLKVSGGDVKINAELEK